MELTGRCKEVFGKWFYINNGITQSMAQFSDLTLYAFLQLPFSMQYGVYIDFFDSVELDIEIYIEIYKSREFFCTQINRKELYWQDTRPLARIEAIKKANEIYNKKFK